MKKAIILVTILFAASSSFAQARLATAEFNKTQQPAIETEIPFEEKTVMKSLVDKMEKKGYKGKESKGYMVFKGVSLPELGAGTYDLYFKTDRKSRKEKDITILTMMVSSGFEKFISETDNATAVDGAKTFLNGQTAHATEYDLEQQIKEQDEVVTKYDKKLKDLAEDSASLVKKKEKLEKEMTENKEKQKDQAAELEKQRLILDTLKGKRKAKQ